MNILQKIFCWIEWRAIKLIVLWTYVALDPLGMFDEYLYICEMICNPIRKSQLTTKFHKNNVKYKYSFN